MYRKPAVKMSAGLKSKADFEIECQFEIVCSSATIECCLQRMDVNLETMRCYDNHLQIGRVIAAPGREKLISPCVIKGGRVMIAFFVNYSTVAFPLHLPTLKRQQFFEKIHVSRYRWMCGAVWRQPVKRWMLAKGE